MAPFDLVGEFDIERTWIVFAFDTRKEPAMLTPSVGDMNPAIPAYSNDYNETWDPFIADLGVFSRTANASNLDAAKAPSQSTANNDFHLRRCQLPGCQDTRAFRQNSAFTKHTDKHTRPYKCPISGCKVKDFGNVGDLRRHRREVHTSLAFICPNLKRTHGEDVVIEPALASSYTTNGNRDVVTSPNGESSPASESGESAGGEMEIVTSKSTDKASSVAKLQELQPLRDEAMAKFDDDIAALEGVLSFM
ncbi:hypothetical protein BGZ57DRAFT_996545 [Hyaloscypha finlandica]|nr:hypothetical protein BGZ57DRAFT_996545 [Hyaloscypha finlandica]